jgi:signal transduction histidine kinase
VHAREHLSGPRLDPVARDAIAAVAFAGLLLACAAANRDQGGEVGAAAAAFALIACAPVALRTINPMASLVATVAGAYLALATFEPQAMVIVPVGYVLYTVAETGTRRRTTAVAVVSIGLTELAMVLFGHRGPFPLEVLEKFALILLPLIAGEAIREHRAFKREQTEQMALEADRRLEQERLRMAREVHDVVAHSMVAINVQAGVAAHLMDRRPEAVREALHDIKRVSGEALRDLRATLGVLRTDGERAPVRPAPGLDGLDDLAARLRAAGIEVTLAVRGGDRPLPSALEGAGFRIVQEALTNVLRHSGAATARVDVAVGPDGLAIEVLDEGRGAAASPAAIEPGSGNGLRGMRERAAAVGGSLEAGPRDGGGWRVAARLPLGVPA